jgi:NTP pyrophosphatase (non-canonical NTP hydrolase)
MDLNVLQKKVDEWIKKYGVRYFDELTNMAQLTEEVGEVARIISRVYGEQSIKKDEKIDDLGEELADVLFVLICLANQTGVNLEKSFDEKLKKKSKRDKTRHLENNKLK